MSFRLVLSVILVFAGTIGYCKVEYEYQYALCKIWGVCKYFSSVESTSEFNTKLPSIIEKFSRIHNDTDYNTAITQLFSDYFTDIYFTSSENSVYSLESKLVNEYIKDSCLYLNERNLNILTNIFIHFHPSKRSPYRSFVFAKRFINLASYQEDVTFRPYNWKKEKSKFSSINYPDTFNRLACLYRYWNTIQFFCFFKDSFESSWNDCLKRTIDKVAGASDSITFSLSMAELAAKMNDFHSYCSSQSIEFGFWGQFSIPIRTKYLRGQTIITTTYPGARYPSGLDKGDVIETIDGKNFDSTRKSIMRYVSASNDTFRQEVIDYWGFLLRRPDSTDEVVLKVRKISGETVISKIKTDVHAFPENRLEGQYGYPFYFIDSTIAYVNVGRTRIKDVARIFKKFHNSPYIIFDYRYYPQGTMFEIAKYLTSSKRKVLTLYANSEKYPGMFDTLYSYIKPVKKKRLYQGEIIILLNEYTQSQAECAVLVIEQCTEKCVKIGRKTAGGGGSVCHTILPGNILMSFTCTAIADSSGKGFYYKKGIVPDINIASVQSEFYNKEDLILNAAINYIKRRQ